MKPKLMIGQRGGKYYINSSGRKVYVNNIEETKKATTRKKVERVQKVQKNGIVKRPTMRTPKKAQTFKTLTRQEEIKSRLRYEKPEYYTVEERNVIGDALVSKEITIQPCDLENLTENTEYKFGQDKGSASNTMIILGNLVYKFVKKQRDFALNYQPENAYRMEELKHAPKQVVIKASFQVRDKRDDNSLEVEMEIYRKLISNLATWGYTPNVILFYNSYVCMDFQQKMKSASITFRSKINSFIHDLELSNRTRGKYDYNRLNVLVLERGRGEPFSSWVLKSHSQEEWFSVLFQIFYTIECFVRLGFRHNDLHLTNIWIETPVKRQFYIYFIDGKTYFVIPITSLVKIYDFDRSTSWNKKIKIFNTFIETECTGYGQCNKANDKFDAFNVLWNLWYESDGKNTAPVFVKQWVLGWFYGKTKLLTDKYGWRGQLCKLHGQGECSGDYRPSDNEMKPILTMLKTSFKMFEHHLPDYDKRYTLENNFPNIFHLPNFVKDVSAWEDRFDHIKPINFGK
jgi:hypothetical protein